MNTTKTTHYTQAVETKDKEENLEKKLGKGERKEKDSLCVGNKDSNYTVHLFENHVRD
jgi:hypothetical protein